MRCPAFIALSLLICLGTPQAQLANGLPRVGDPVPAVALPDVAGHKHSLTEWKNKPRTLFFFCGCAPCQDCARLWAAAQQAGEVSRGRPAKGPQTVVVFLGDPDSARQFTTDTGLVPSETLMLVDPTDQTGQRFGVVQCPRVFVLDARGRLTYTNPENDSRKKRLSAAALVSRALTALRRLPATCLSQTAPQRTNP